MELVLITGRSGKTCQSVIFGLTDEVGISEKIDTDYQGESSEGHLICENPV